MAVLTNFLKLLKPEKNDYVDVDKHISENYDKIDSKMQELNTSNNGKLDKGAVSSEYDTAKKIEDKIKEAQSTADNKLDKGNVLEKYNTAEKIGNEIDLKQNKIDNNLQTPSKNIVDGMNELTWYQKPKQLIGGTSKETAVDLLEYVKTLKEGIYVCDYYSGNGWFKNLPYPIFNANYAENRDFFLEIIPYRPKRSAFNETTIIKFYTEIPGEIGGYIEAVNLFSSSQQKFLGWRYNLSSSSIFNLAQFGYDSSYSRFIQDKVTKIKDKTYQDANTGKIYRCKEATTDTTVTNKFEIITNNELAKKTSEYIVEYKEINTSTRYRKWNSGLLEIWGIEDKIAGGMVTRHNITFPISFIDTNYTVQITYQGELNPIYCNVVTSSKTINGCIVDWSSDSNYSSPYYAVGKWK